MIEDTPDNIDAQRQRTIEELQKSDEFVVFCLQGEGTDDEAVMSIVSARARHFGAFAQAMQTCQLKMVHDTIGMMLGEEQGVTELDPHTWASQAEPLPDPDTVEVPDFVPDFSSDDWNTPGGEFPTNDGGAS